MKKFLALVLSTAMVMSMTVFAASPAKETATEAPAPVVEAAVETAATASGMSVAEYVNNTVGTSAALPEAIPAVVSRTAMLPDGTTTKAPEIAKPSVAVTKQVAAVATACNPGSKVLNVIEVKSATATMNKPVAMSCGMAGVKATDNIRVYQIVNGKILQVPTIIINGRIFFLVFGNGPVSITRK